MYLLNRPADAMRFLDGKSTDHCAHNKSSPALLALLVGGCGPGEQSVRGVCTKLKWTKCGEDAGCPAYEGRQYTRGEDCKVTSTGCHQNHCVGADMVRA